MTMMDEPGLLNDPDEIPPAEDPFAQEVSPAQFAPLGVAPADGAVASLDLLGDVSIEISVELGRARMSFAEVMALKVGKVIELNKLAGEAGDVYVNGTLIGRGEIVVMDDRFGIRVFDVVSRPHFTR